MRVLNFTHPLIPVHIAQLEAITGTLVEKVISVKAHIDTEKPLMPQVVALADQAQLSAAEWETLPIVVNPPSLNYIAVALLAELHGRMGYFPAQIRLRPVQEHGLTRYRVAEVLDLQSIRDTARGRRK